MSGPSWRLGPEPYESHQSRLGRLPHGGRETLAALAESDLRGRGGARFPAARKWETVRANGAHYVLANGAEGEPASRKDELLLQARPHLVIDGAVIAAESVGAREVVFHLNRRRPAAAQALKSALRERSHPRIRVSVLDAPNRYVAGEESAAVNFANTGQARPVFTPPRPFEKGIHGRPTLIQNVETLAYAALIARHGPDWFRGPGGACALLTVSGRVARPGVYEVPRGTPLREVIEVAGGSIEASGGVLTGGYFGTFVDPATAAGLMLEDDSFAAAGARIGCGVIYVLAPDHCGLRTTARLLHYLAREGAQQCGPCINGVPALASTLERVAAGGGRLEDHVNLERWRSQLATARGACRLPDGAVGLLNSALRTFAADLARHREGGGCGRPGDDGLPAPLALDGWT